MNLDPSGEILWKNPLWEHGWVEILSKDIVAGVKEEDKKTVMVVKSAG